MSGLYIDSSGLYLGTSLQSQSMLGTAGLLQPGPYLPQSLALFSRMTTTPSTARMNTINALIGSLVTSGVWAKLDCLWVFAAHNAQAAGLNWCSSSFTASPVNAPAFVLDSGYTGNGTSSYLDTGFNPASASAPKFTQNDAHMGLFSLSNLANGAASSNDFGNDTAFIARDVSTSSRSRGRPNTASAVIFSAFVGYPGHVVWTRTGASAWSGYANGALDQTGTTASVAPTSANIRVLAINGVSFGVNTIMAAHLGGSLSGAETAAFYSALAAYKAAVGA